MVYQRRQRWSRYDNIMIVYPQYEWAFDLSGWPVHISQAARGGEYICPLCRDRVIPKMGGIKQHHFAHERERMCHPDEVVRAAAGRWLYRELDQLIRTRREVATAWPCPLCKKTHSINLLAGIRDVREEYTPKGMTSHVALLDAHGQVKVIIMLTALEREALAEYLQQEIMVIVVGLAHFRHSLHSLEDVLAGAVISGGICITQQDAARRGIIAHVTGLREALTQAVMVPPYYIYGPLEEEADLTHVLTLGDKKLWLPPILWQRAIGGLLHSISPTLQIITQEWPQPDGATIALYYVTVKGTNAMAARRFPPGQPVYARIDPGVFRAGRPEAVNVARSFAEV